MIQSARARAAQTEPPPLSLLLYVQRKLLRDVYIYTRGVHLQLIRVHIYIYWWAYTHLSARARKSDRFRQSPSTRETRVSNEVLLADKSAGRGFYRWIMMFASWRSGNREGKTYTCVDVHGIIYMYERSANVGVCAYAMNAIYLYVYRMREQQGFSCWLFARSWWETRKRGECIAVRANAALVFIWKWKIVSGLLSASLY